MITNLFDHEYIERSFFYSLEDSCKNLSMYLYGKIWTVKHTIDPIDC
jgi:hypothetical protein